MFKQNPDKISYPEIEKQISEFWKKNQIFEKSISERSEKKSYTFYEGPPTANGKPGIHHVMARSLKDIICRYKTLRGYQVHRKAGWDTHGLPVEIEVEKALGIKSKDQIPVFGVDKYNAACRESVFTYKDLWEKMTERMGYWIDLDDAYITCTNEYIESVWWSLKTLFDKGLIYKDYKIVPQCPRSETVLSSHELALGYKMTKDPSVYALFKMKESDEYILVWTTTPWTLISNVALAFGSDVDYVKVLHKEKKIILAKARLAVLDGEYEILEEFKGASMEHKEYEQLLPYITPQKKAFYIVLGDFVSTEDGTGIVHIAPAFGADDYEISKKYGLPMMQPVRPNGTFTSEVPDFENVFFKDADNGILKKMKAEGKLYKKDTIEHSYPFSWRFDDVPVLYYARESWFIRTTSVAERMVELNATINWYPPETGSGRFGNWLAENKDWALSRDRFWATPLPIWLSDDGDMIAIGSIEELKQGFLYEGDKKVPVSEVKEIDLHKPFIDKVFFEKNGKIYKRTPELIDVWYDSGAMPFAQYHYPFENKEWFESNFPADYISEGIDQTRGWFYTLHAISTMLFDKVAYRNVLVNDLILDKEGRKMSKSKGNTVDPFMLFDKYGADATRWYLIINSPPWKPTLFNEDDLAENQRKFFGTLMNTYSFFVMYANIDKFTFAEDLIPYDQRPETDRWIISKLNSVTAEYLRLMDEYDITKAARLISNFTIDQVSNWYVRRSRRRFWKSEMNQNKLSAYQTLYEVLERITKLMAPITPFIAEDIYQSLNSVTGNEKFESVHLALFEQPEYFDQALEDKMETAQQVVSMTRGMRAKLNLKIRQPLSKLMVAVDPSKADALRTMEEVVLEELNIKELQILSDDSGIVSKSAKPNFKAIGPRFGKQVNQVAGMIKELPADQVAKLDKGESVELSLNGAAVTITPADVEIISSDIKGWSVESDNGITVALDTELTEVLIAEGLSREFVNRVQNMRKDAGFEVTDRIRIVYTADDQLTKAVEQFKGSIASETLASEVLNGSAAGGGYRQSWVIDKFNAEIEIQKV